MEYKLNGGPRNTSGIPAKNCCYIHKPNPVLILGLIQLAHNENLFNTKSHPQDSSVLSLVPFGVYVMSVSPRNWLVH